MDLLNVESGVQFVTRFGMILTYVGKCMDGHLLVDEDDEYYTCNFDGHIKNSKDKIVARLNMN